MKDHIPLVKPSQKAKKQPWLNSDAILPCAEKRKAFKKWTYCKTERNWQTYAEKRNKATRSCRATKVNFERELASSIKTDPKSFHSYVRSQLKSKSHIADLESQDGSLLSSEVQKAEVLNSFCSSAVKKKPSSLKTDKSPDMGAIHPFLFKECASEICDSVADLFNLLFHCFSR